MLDEIAAGARFASGLRSLLRNPLRLEQARAQVQERLRAREQMFLHIAQRGIYPHPRSPFCRLLLHAGIRLDDLTEMVAKHPIEQTLQRLHAAGVYVTLEEYKGRRPVTRGSLTFTVEQRDFDNPLTARHYDVTSGGSRSPGTRIFVDLDLVGYEAAYHLLYQAAFGLLDRPMAVWRPLPPGSAGMKNSLYQLKTGRRLEKWFHHNKPALDRRSMKYRAFTAAAVYGSRLFGRPLPVPQHVPPTAGATVARWLARMCARGTPALLDSSCSSAVRVCLAAQRLGLDLCDTFFRVGGEPFTPAKARVIADSGGRATPHYSMSEVGRIGIGCAAPAVLDDMHVMHDKFAVINRDRHVSGALAPPVKTLLLTTLHPSTPKLMLNVETDDYAVLEHRECGCPIGALGMRLHVHTLRSVEKLSSEGMSFIGADLIDLVEEVLPARFGGSATDYQFLEEEDGGLPRVSLIVSPRLGAMDESRVVEIVLEKLARPSGGSQMMADVWRRGNTLRVVRREPSVTAAAKILPLHIERRR